MHLRDMISKFPEPTKRKEWDLTELTDANLVLSHIYSRSAVETKEQIL
jgi:hypothetical protein